MCKSTLKSAKNSTLKSTIWRSEPYSGAGGGLETLKLADMICVCVCGVRFWSPNSAFKSAIFSTFKSAFTQKRAFESANKSANNSNFLLKVPIIVL